VGETVQVGDGLVVELQRGGQAFEDLVGGVLVAALLQAQVVLGADAGQVGNLLTAQPRDATALTCRSATSRTSTVLVRIGGAARMAPVSIAWMMRIELE
jgi:hypothetical protein